MCHQIHTLLNVPFSRSVYIPQVHRAFLKGILGFCVNPILSPYRLPGPSAWWVTLRVKGLRLSRASVHLLSAGNWKDQPVTAQQRRGAFPHLESQTHPVYELTALLPCSLWHLSKMKWEHSVGKVCVF